MVSPAGQLGPRRTRSRGEKGGTWARVLGAEPRETSVGGPRRADSWGLGAPGKHVDGTCRLAADGPPLTGQWQPLLEQSRQCLCSRNLGALSPVFGLGGCVTFGTKVEVGKANLPSLVAGLRLRDTLCHHLLRPNLSFASNVVQDVEVL